MNAEHNFIIILMITHNLLAILDDRDNGWFMPWLHYSFIIKMINTVRILKCRKILAAVALCLFGNVVLAVYWEIEIMLTL